MILVFHSRAIVALAGGFAFGIAFFGCHLYWVAIFGKLPWFALAVFQCLYVVMWVVAVRFIGMKLGQWERLVLLPSAWVCMEWARSLGILGFTWGDLAYSQHRVLPVTQIASVTGAWGVSFLVALWNAMLANLLAVGRARRAVPWAQFGSVLLFVFIVCAYGLVALRSPDRSLMCFRAAAVQGNINTDTIHDLAYYDKCHATYRGLTRKAALAGAKLIVWPETSEPGYPARDQFLEYALSELAEQANAYILVGAHDVDSMGRCFNSGFLIAPGHGIVGQYSKVRLVPFGEYVPARRYLPFLSYYRVTPVDMTPGSGFNLLDAGGLKIGLAICFESIFPYISRTLTRSGAEILCVITNDAWFLRTSAAEQHLSKSVFRAVENGRYLIRAATTGISCIIDPHGRVLASKGIFTRGIVLAEVTPLRQMTIYTRMGDWFVYLCLAVVVGTGILAIFWSRHKA